MPNNIGRTVADASGFIPQVWAQRALDILASVIVMTRLVARDFDYEPGWKGKTLNIPYPGTFTAQDNAENTPATVQQPVNGTTKQVTLNKSKYVDFIVEDIAQAQANSNLLDRYVEPAAIAIADAVEDDILALYAQFSTSIGTSGTDLTRQMIFQARQNFNQKKVPMAGRALVMSPKDETALLNDATLQNYFAFSKPDAVAKGSLGNIAGLDLYMSQRISVVNGTPNSTKNFAPHKDAIILATRPFVDPPAGSGVQVASVADPRSGLVIRVLRQYSMGDRGVRVGFDILYGVAQLRDESGLVVLS